MSTETGDDISAEVRTALARDPTVSVFELEVTTLSGHVFLSGMTETDGSREAAEQAARRVPGVRRVTNSIVVDPEAYDLRTDSDIWTDVRMAFTADTFVPINHVNVHVRDGVVTLSGTLRNPRQREAAVDDAAQVAGVKGVIDSITVTPDDEVDSAERASHELCARL